MGVDEIPQAQDISLQQTPQGKVQDRLMPQGGLDGPNPKLSTVVPSQQDENSVRPGQEYSPSGYESRGSFAKNDAVPDPLTGALRASSDEGLRVIERRAGPGYPNAGGPLGGEARLELQIADEDTLRGDGLTLSIRELADYEAERGNLGESHLPKAESNLIGRDVPRHDADVRRTEPDIITTEMNPGPVMRPDFGDGPVFENNRVLEEVDVNSPRVSQQREGVNIEGKAPEGPSSKVGDYSKN